MTGAARVKHAGTASRVTAVSGALLRAEIQAASAYRAQILLGLFGWVVPLAFMALWRGAAEDGDVVGVTGAQFTTYFAVMLITTNMTIAPFLVGGFTNWIHSGQLSAMLLRPAHPLLTLIARAVAQKCYRVPPVLLAVPVLIVVSGGTVTDRLSALVLAPVVAILGLVSVTYVAALVAMIAFWMTKAAGVQGLLSGIDWLAGGLVAPIALLPGFLPGVLRHQPFWFAGGAPAEIVAGIGHHSGWIVAEAVAWVIALHLVFQHVWRRGLRRFEAVGT